MSQSSFYGGRPGISFRIVKRFDGIDIPQNSGSIVYKRKEYAIRTITDEEYFIYPFIEKTGSNYQDYDWNICILDGGSKNVVYSNNTTGTETVKALPAEGMVQCFSQGGDTTHEVNYGEYVIIDTIKDMADYDNPDNGKLFRRGTNLNYDAETNPYYGGEFVGTLVGPRGYIGPKGSQGIQGPPGPQGEKGDPGNYNILGIYATAGDIPNQPPEVIMDDESYRGWDIAVGNITDPDSSYRLYVYDYRLGTWNDVGTYSGNSDDNIYAVCSTAGNVAAKTVNLTNYILKTGARLIVKFENENIADNPTLNVTNTGAKTLIANSTSAKDVITADSVFLVVYDGTNYVLVGGVGSASDDDFIGTTAEWNALSPAEKAEYADSIIFITDDTEGGGSSGGHIIVDSSDTSMTQRSKLKFVNATVTDDSINDTTVVTMSGSAAPIATVSTPGIVQPDGTTINVTQEGVISANIPTPTPIATTSVAGKVKPDGTNIGIDNTGLLSLDPYNYKLDRKHMLEDVAYTYEINGIETTLMNDPEILQTITIDSPGLYYISFSGYVRVKGNTETYVSAYIKKNNLANEYIKAKSYSSSGQKTEGISLSNSGFMILNRNDILRFKEIFFGEEQSIVTFQGTLDIFKVYDFLHSDTSYWWQQQTIQTS